MTKWLQAPGKSEIDSIRERDEIRLVPPERIARDALPPHCKNFFGA